MKTSQFALTVCMLMLLTTTAIVTPAQTGADNAKASAEIMQKAGGVGGSA